MQYVNPTKISTFTWRSIRQALPVVASSWLFSLLVVAWICVSVFAAGEQSTWSWLRRVPVLGIVFDFARCVPDFLEAQYEVSFLCSWLPGALKDIYTLPPSWKSFTQWAHTAKTFAAR